MSLNNEQLKELNFIDDKIELLALEPQTASAIAYKEKELLLLKEDCKLIYNIYIPENHPIIKDSLLRVGRKILFTYNKPINGKRSPDRIYGNVLSYERIPKEKVKMYIHSLYENDKDYIKIDVIFDRKELILNVTGRPLEDY
jgi:hypothetical protein